MKVKTLTEGTGAAIIITVAGASPMLFGVSLAETLNMQPFAAMLVFGGAIATVGMMAYLGYVMDGAGLKPPWR